MKTVHFALLITLLNSIGCASAQGQSDGGQAQSIIAKPPFLIIEDAAKDAVACVDRFSKALALGRIDQLNAELDPNVLILESGGAQYSAAEYLGGHAKADADFLKGAQIQLNRRTGQAIGNLAWVTTESDIALTKEGKVSTTLSTETMVLKRTGLAWRIVHIHWSSHTKK
jgi:SnoaL-like domain